jgi:hypothetical protein
LARRTDDRQANCDGEAQVRADSWQHAAVEQGSAVAQQYLGAPAHVDSEGLRVRPVSEIKDIVPAGPAVTQICQSDQKLIGGLLVCARK